jgi:AbiV family abortive infection protein
MAKPDQDHLALLTACVVNSRALLNSAKAVEQAGHHNIAYHLATLSLEELGKREIYQLQNVARAVGDPPPWQVNAVQDHAKKLFWCLYSLGSVSDATNQEQFFDKLKSAGEIHERRLAGLYVESAEGSLNIPSSAVSPRQAAALIKLATLLVEYAEAQKPREDIPSEELELQVWFLKAMDDDVQRKRILNQRSIARLKELNDIAAWSRETKTEMELEEASLRQLAERELNREPIADGKERKERWKVRIRLETSSNSVRPAFIKKWNENIFWIKMVSVQGARKKDHLIVEFILGDDVPAAGLWPFGFTLSLRMVIALNLATSGFWWWPQNSSKTKYYDSIYDMETKHGLELEASGFHVFEQHAALTEVHANNLVMCFTALPDDPRDPKRGQSYQAYLGGLNFLATNSITWRCESWAYGQFFEAFKGLIAEANYRLPDEPSGTAIGRFLDEKYPSLDRGSRDEFTGLADAFEAKQNVSVKIADVFLMKLLCEEIFRGKIIPMINSQRLDKA